MKHNHVYMVLGMHRSGTSYVAALLHHIHIHMGDHLLGADWSNINGHYEDLDFLNLHEEMLHQLNMDPYTDQPIEMNALSTFHSKALELVDKKMSSGLPWGWKDPRTALFLSFWKSIIEKPVMIIVLRHFNPVVSSLLNREYSKRFRHIRRHHRIMKTFERLKYERDISIRAHVFLKSWIRHYSTIIDNVGANPIVISMDQPINWTINSLLSQFADRGINFAEPEPMKWRRKKEIKKKFNLVFDPGLLKQAEELYQKLMKMCIQ